MRLKVIAGKFKGVHLKTPRHSTRPTASVAKEALFNLCQSEIQKATCLDLFAGSGALGIEAISRGAKFCVFVDHSREAIHSLKENIEKLHITDQAQIFYGDIKKIIKKLKSLSILFDLIFMDPPYDTASDVYTSYLELICSKDLLNSPSQIFLERKFSKDIKDFHLEKLIHLQNKKYGNTLLQQFLFKY